MIKFFLSVAIIATLASCSKNEVIDNETSSSTRIGFSTLNDKVTRAANDSNANYAVYAQFTTPTAGWYITALDVTAPQAGNDSYTGSHYWPEAALNFYAYAPFGSANADITAFTAPTTSLGAMNITYTVPSGANEDFTVATPITNQESTTIGGQVAFTFAHMLSKVNIKAVLDPALVEDGYTLSLGEAKLTVNKNKGTVDATNSNPSLTAGADANTTYSASMTTGTIVPYLVMPQSTQNCKAEITGAIVKKDGQTDIAVSLVYTFSEGDVKLGTFEAGKLYNLNFTVNLEEITFSSQTGAWGAANDISL